MRTQIDPARLRELREQGFEEAKSGRPFVNPHAAAKSKDVMRRRGEEWASSVCGRVFDRRSIWYPTLPWLNEGEMETLILADAEEDRAAFADIVGEQ